MFDLLHILSLQFSSLSSCAQEASRTYGGFGWLWKTTTEWLVDRRKLQANWKQELRKVKEKVATALPQLPADNAEIQALLKDFQPCTHASTASPFASTHLTRVRRVRVRRVRCVSLA